MSPHRLAQFGCIAGALVPLLVSAWALCAPDGPAPLVSVRIGGEELARAEVAHAQSKCSTHMPELTLTECLDRFFVPRWLLDRLVREERRDSAPAWAFERDDLLHLALVAQLEHTVPAPTQADVERYIKEHPRDHHKPLRIRILRLLVNGEDEAKRLLSQLLQDPLDLTRFRALCREHSVDKATSERGGDLGFVWPDGSTDVPEVSADPALYAAALPIKEGQIAPLVVPEGKHFAIVWRRGSLPMEVTTEAEQQRIVALLKERSVEAQVESLLHRLKETAVKDRADVLLGRLRRKDTRLFAEP